MEVGLALAISRRSRTVACAREFDAFKATKYESFPEPWNGQIALISNRVTALAVDEFTTLSKCSWKSYAWPLTHTQFFEQS